MQESGRAGGQAGWRGLPPVAPLRLNPCLASASALPAPRTQIVTLVRYGGKPVAPAPFPATPAAGFEQLKTALAGNRYFVEVGGLLCWRRGEASSLQQAPAPGPPPPRPLRALRRRPVRPPLLGPPASAHRPARRPAPPPPQAVKDELPFDRYFLVFQPAVLQYWADDMSDLNGLQDFVAAQLFARVFSLGRLPGLTASTQKEQQ